MRLGLSRPPLPPTVSIAPPWRRRPILCLSLAALTVLAWFGRDRERPTDDLATYDNRVFSVAGVVDGDTFDLGWPDGPHPTTRVRLWGVDTPEITNGGAGPMHYGPEASSFARELLEGRMVRIRLAPSVTRDKHDRLLAYVVIEDTGERFNELLLSGGYAYADWRFAHPLDTQYRALEQEAREHRVGLWANLRPADMPPWRQRMERGEP